MLNNLVGHIQFRMADNNNMKSSDSTIQKEKFLDVKMDMSYLKNDHNNMSKHNISEKKGANKSART